MRAGLESLEDPVEVKWVRRLLLLADGDSGSADTHTRAFMPHFLHFAEPSYGRN